MTRRHTCCTCGEQIAAGGAHLRSRSLAQVAFCRRCLIRALGLAYIRQVRVEL